MFRIMIMTLLLTNVAWAGEEVTNLVPPPTDITLTKVNSVVLQAYFETKTITLLKQQLLRLDQELREGELIYLVLDSGGGSIQAGYELIDFVAGLKHEVATITIWSASMAFQTVQGLGRRLITTTGTLMSHKARGVFYGQFPGEANSRMKYWMQRILDGDIRAVERTKGKQTLESYRKLYELEYWCDGQACVDAGFADAVVTPKCGSDLSGTKHVVVDKWLQGGNWFKIIEKRSECPLNVGYLDWYIDIEALGYGTTGKLTPEDIDLAEKRFEKIQSNRRTPVMSFGDLNAR